MNHGSDASRWGGSLAVVVLLHAGAVAGMLSGEGHALPPVPPPAALMIELAPLPSAPQTTPNEKPPAEKQKVAEPPKLRTPSPLPKPPVVNKAEVMVNRPKERSPEMPPDKPPPKVEEASAPPSVSAPPAETVAAPAQGASVAPASNAVPTWQGTLLAHLEKHKRYPRAAQLRRQQGVAYVAFTIDREGNVVAQRLHRSSAHDSLDQETLDLLQRAQPLPAPPPDVVGERVDLIVPVQFFLK